MTDSLASLPQWFSMRPKWLEFAAKHFLEKGEFSTEDISEFASLCLREAEGKLADTDYSFSATAFSPSVTSDLRLCSISDVRGVNALAPTKPLEFGQGNISAVYGYNGSGKSGYVRLLKHVCGARHPGTLYPNVYTNSPNEQKATIKFKKNGTDLSYNWTGQDICDDLESVDIFDTSFGRVFVENEAEVSYEPPALSFFSSLIEICGKVDLDLDLEARQHQSKKPDIPTQLKSTPEGRWYDNIKAETTAEDIEKHCFFESKDKAEIQNLQQRLQEQSPAKKAEQLRKQKTYADALIQDALKHLEQLSDENCRQIIAVKNKSILKKEAADTAAQKAFSDSHFEGIGSDVWKELWEAARNYSIKEAYENIDYPNISKDSKCVLCHQPLSQEAKERLVSFEEFVKGEMQRASEVAANEYKSAIQAIEDIPSSDSLNTRLDAADIREDETRRSIIKFFSDLQTRKEQLPGLNSGEKISTVPQMPKWIESVKAISSDREKVAEKYEVDAIGNNRDEIKKKLDTLLAKEWLSKQRVAIEEEIKRLKLLNRIQHARKTTNTKFLSQKKGALAEMLITAAFVERFNEELKTLEALKIRVELLKTKVSKGQVLHKIRLRRAPGSPLADVLSEGERKIVSIAAFLADVRGKSGQIPVVFDDPTSSLDQDFEEALVRRLVDLSHNRQVIVFTHRLPFLGMLRQFTEKEPIKLDIFSIRLAKWGTGEPSPIPISQSEIKSALNTLIGQCHQDAREAKDRGNYEHAEMFLKSICSDFRMLVERSIENDLLCGIVQRYQRPVHSLKLKDLAKKFEKSDCQLLESLMTKYSRFEHSQPAESPVQLPELSDVLADMEMLKNWREEYKKRN